MMIMKIYLMKSNDDNVNMWKRLMVKFGNFGPDQTRKILAVVQSILHFFKTKIWKGNKRDMNLLRQKYVV